MKKAAAALLLAMLLLLAGGCGKSAESAAPPAAEDAAVIPAPETPSPDPEPPAKEEMLTPEIVAMPEIYVAPGESRLEIFETEEKPEREAEEKPEKEPEEREQETEPEEGEPENPGEPESVSAAGGGVKLTVSFGEHSYRATLADSCAAVAFVELLTENGGSITVFSNDFSAVEKVGYLPEELPTENREITAVAGDIVLWMGRQLALYYAENTWSMTRLGRLDDPAGLREALGAGDVSITYTLANG